MSYQINRKIRDAFILNLRSIFAVDPKYTYVETPGGEYDYQATKIIISDAIPTESAFFPALLVSAIPAQESRYLGPETLGETKDGNNVTTGDEKFSSIVSNVSLTLHTIDDTIARDEIIDTIYQQFKLLTTELANDGIEIIESSFSPDRRQFVKDRWYITATVNMRVYTEWKTDLGPGTTLAKIPIDLQLIP